MVEGVVQSIMIATAVKLAQGGVTKAVKYQRHAQEFYLWTCRSLSLFRTEYSQRSSTHS